MLDVGKPWTSTNGGAPGVPHRRLKMLTSCPPLAAVVDRQRSSVASRCHSAKMSKPPAYVVQHLPGRSGWPRFPAGHGSQRSGEYRSHSGRSPALFDERGQGGGGSERVVVEVNDGDVLVVGAPPAGQVAPPGARTECPGADGAGCGEQRRIMFGMQPLQPLVGAAVGGLLDDQQDSA